jgi:hypothetical protein
MTKPREVDHRINESLAAFRLALRRFLAFSETATGAVGVTAQQYPHPGRTQESRDVGLVSGEPDAGSILPEDRLSRDPARQDLRGPCKQLARAQVRSGRPASEYR